MSQEKIRVITYGTFDLFHIGHLKLLERARELGDELYVGVSTDEFNALKGKNTKIPFQQRISIVSALKHVTEAFAESSWEQKEGDINSLGISIFVMGDDWLGKFDHLKPFCDVVYLERTPGISSTSLKQGLTVLEKPVLLFNK